MGGGIPIRLIFCLIGGIGLTTAVTHGVGDATIGHDPVWVPPEDGATQSPVQIGVASWYGVDHQGKLTASGRRFDWRKLTAAHPSLPLNSKAKVTNLANGKSVEVTINDRGPGAPGRAIDVSERAAQKLGMKKGGLAPVEIVPLARPDGQVANR